MRSAPAAPALPGITWSTAAFAYEGVARELVARVKYRNERIAVRWLGARVAQRCALAPRIDVVTWIPASATRRAARGIDHGALLARVVAERLGYGAERLLWRDGGPPQTGRPAAERRAGPRLHARGSISGRSVLVVDDVVTTGATLTAAARVLRALGASDVLAATVARTPRPVDRVPGAPYTQPAVRVSATADDPANGRGSTHGRRGRR